MQTKVIAVAVTIIAMLALGCDNGSSARFANIDGLARGYDKYEHGGLFCVWGCAKELIDSEKPEAVKKFPFVAQFFKTQSCKGTFIYLASKIGFPIGKMIPLCGEWVRTPGLNYLLHK